MSERLGLPKGLKDYGVQTQQFSGIVSGAMKDHCHLTNPIRASEEDYKGLLLQSM